MSLSSGSSRVTSSSRVNWPRSTHCRAEIAVISFVHDAIQYIASSSRGLGVLLSFKEQRPNDLAYEYEPEFPSSG
jgi:hypothetical protein